MQLGNAELHVPPPPPVKPAAPVREADPHDALRDGQRREEAFERALEQELEKRHPSQMLPPPAPWLLTQATQPVDGEQTVEAALATSSEDGGALKRLMLLAGPVKARGATGEIDPDELVAAVKPRGGEEPDASKVAVVVEAGLPPVQPAEHEPMRVVPLVEFPQVVVGTVRELKDKGQPVTRLDFEISPPHVGPVNLQVSVQNGSVNVQLVALTMQAKQALESQVGQIQQILASHQLNPGQVKVVTGPVGKHSPGAGGKGDAGQGFGMFHGGRRRSGADQDHVAEA